MKSFLIAAFAALTMQVSAQSVEIPVPYLDTEKEITGTLQDGYRTIVDVSYTFGQGDYGHNNLGAAGIFGYQFNANLFVGGGLALQYDFEAEKVKMPLFADVRYDILDNNITPYADARLGYTILDGRGLYFNPSVGIRIALARTGSVNLGLGYTLQLSKVSVLDHSTGYYTRKTKDIGGLTIRMGFDF